MLGRKLSLLSKTNFTDTAKTYGDVCEITKQGIKEAAGRIKYNNDSGTLPTIDAGIEYSLDNTTWKTLLTFTQGTNGTSQEEVVHVNSDTTRLARFYRAYVDLGGTLPQYDVTVELWYG
jgi:hypothetical protein